MFPPCTIQLFLHRVNFFSFKKNRLEKNLQDAYNNEIFLVRENEEEEEGIKEEGGSEDGNNEEEEEEGEEEEEEEKEEVKEEEIKQEENIEEEKEKKDKEDTLLLRMVIIFCYTFNLFVTKILKVFSNE